MQKGFSIIFVTVSCRLPYLLWEIFCRFRTVRATIIHCFSHGSYNGRTESLSAEKYQYSAQKMSVSGPWRLFVGVFCNTVSKATALLSVFSCLNMLQSPRPGAATERWPAEHEGSRCIASEHVSPVWSYCTGVATRIDKPTCAGIRFDQALRNLNVPVERCNLGFSAPCIIFGGLEINRPKSIDQSVNQTTNQPPNLWTSMGSMSQCLGHRSMAQQRGCSANTLKWKEIMEEEDPG